MVLLVLLASVFAPSAAAAQVSITGAITGTVTIPSDAVLPGATVQLKDEGTGQPRERPSPTSPGAFAFRDLSFGSYQVTVTLQGFQSALYKKVVVESGRTTDLRVKLAARRPRRRPSPSKARRRCSR